MTCKWDADTSTYMTPDGEECDTPRRDHCTARRTCSQHLGWGELTCARCLGRVRTNIRRIAEVAPLLMTAALETRRIDSEAANLAGPACDPEAWSWRKVAAMQGRAWHWSQLEEDDERHPYTVLTRWEFMIREDYDQPRTTRTSITSAAAYLDRVLSKVAQDEDQDFRLLAGEVRRCRDHLDAELRVREFHQKGAPCPDCRAHDRITPLVIEYGHDVTGKDDRWVCSRDRSHWRSPQDYERWVEERMGA